VILTQIEAETTGALSRKEHHPLHYYYTHQHTLTHTLSTLLLHTPAHTHTHSEECSGILFLSVDLFPCKGKDLHKVCVLLLM